MVDRAALWDFLCSSCTQMAWVVLGDSNCVRKVEERISDAPPNLPAMNDFNAAIYSAGLKDLTTCGHEFTWINKQDGSACKWMRLDRVLVNVGWQTYFPSAFATAHNAGISDHSPIVITVGTFSPCPRQFRFLNCWSLDKNFIPIVTDVWKNTVKGCPCLNWLLISSKLGLGFSIYIEVSILTLMFGGKSCLTNFMTVRIKSAFTLLVCHSLRRKMSFVQNSVK
ncbi:hypothetical protein RND81_06G080800 [Saponaria officinalis]|uniref:Uncharacterized protein n=1 Tax=Saponaria officinalis TaxID=3572 RepID=A0AAW1K8N9_SAPOF